MGRTDQGRHHDEQLNRIVAMLFSLADIAEGASRRAAPLCLLMLWILRPAEAVAQRLVMKWTQDLVEASPFARRMIGSGADFACGWRVSFGPAAGSAGGLIAMALSLRELAIALQALSVLEQHCWPEGGFDFRPEAAWGDDCANRFLDVGRLAGSFRNALAYVRPEVRAGVSPVPS